MKARWEQIATPVQSYNLAGAPSVVGNAVQWVAVDEDDEVVAYISPRGVMWTAITPDTGSGGQKQGTFLSEDAAKRKVQKWLHPAYDFNTQNTGWVYAVSP